MSSELDMSQPLSAVLHTGTAAAHERAEHSQGAVWLARGQLAEAEYARYLMMLWHVYHALESALEAHAAHQALAPTHDPALFRSAQLAADIRHFLGLHVPDTPDAWQAHPAHTALMHAPPPALTAYLARLHALTSAPDHAPLLLAHAYVRYLGDLSGGQHIRRALARAYDLRDGRGLQFYDFGGPTEVRRIKMWFRAGMDRAVGEDRALKAALLQEAIAAFEFSAGLFDALRAPTPSAAEGSPVEPADAPGVQDAEVKVLQRRQSAHPISSVLSIIVAMSLAHFILAVGGFVGYSGSAKLAALQSWLATR